MPGSAVMIAAFDPALPLRAWSSHCGIGSGSTTSSSLSAAKRIRQQFLRLRRRPHDLAHAVDGEQIAAGDVERGARALGQPRIGEVDADARQHLLDRNGLCHIIDAAGLQPANDVFGFGQPRHEDDRHVVEPGVALQPPAGFKTVQAGHDRVEQDDVGRDLVDDPHRGCAVERDHDRHAGAVERVGEQPQRLRRIIDDEGDVALFGFSDHSCAVFSGSPCTGRDRSGRSSARICDTKSACSG